MKIIALLLDQPNLFNQVMRIQMTINTVGHLLVHKC
jgi:hypothetical protein